MSDEEGGTPADELKSKQKREKKELTAKITSMKHATSKTDKKKRRPSPNEPKAEDPPQSTAKGNEEAAKGEPKKTRAQKQREKKAEAEKKRAQAAAADAVSAQTSRGALETRRIAERLAERKLRLVDVEPNGDCMYNAISHQLNLVDGTAKTTGDAVRVRAADFMTENRDDFIHFLEDEFADDEGFQRYLSKVRNSCRVGGDWGGELELKAISGAFNRPIRVIHADGEPHFFGEELRSPPLVITALLQMFLLDALYEVRALVFDFLVYCTEWIFGLHTFKSITANNRLSPAERTERVERLLLHGEETDEAEGLLVAEVADSEERVDMAKILAVPRKSNQWQEIGFQGEEPATDWRGMGILGLENLVFYAQHDAENCRRVLKLSEHEVYGFPFAICGITITALCRELLINGYLRNHFSNSSKEAPTLDSFHHVYCRVFNLFGDYWDERRPANVMLFNEVKNEFVNLLKKYLKKNKADLLTSDLAALSVCK
ncbi:hypothetical protein M3Y99_01892800 [Aphelenchoides fujianensis]|nr:hypothetical protein M3Y99_01892800 [Aphelenchoides fujianensis]